MKNVCYFCALISHVLDLLELVIQILRNLDFVHQVVHLMRCVKTITAIPNGSFSKQRVIGVKWKWRRIVFVVLSLAHKLILSWVVLNTVVHSIGLLHVLGVLKGPF
jgi:hypothetical protein